MEGGFYESPEHREALMQRARELMGILRRSICGPDIPGDELERLMDELDEMESNLTPEDNQTLMDELH